MTRHHHFGAPKAADLLDRVGAETSDYLTRVLTLAVETAAALTETAAEAASHYAYRASDHAARALDDVEHRITRGRR